MSFRQQQQQPAAGTPLIWISNGLLVALDPETGARRWERRFEHTPERVYSFTGALFVACDDEKRLHVLDVSTGELAPPLELGFNVTAGLVTAGALHVAGYDGAARIGADRRITWSVLIEVRDGGLFKSSQRTFVARNAAQEELWRVESTSVASTNAGLVLGDVTMQPDIDHV